MYVQMPGNTTILARAETWKNQPSWSIGKAWKKGCSNRWLRIAGGEPTQATAGAACQRSGNSMQRWTRKTTWMCGCKKGSKGRGQCRSTTKPILMKSDAPDRGSHPKHGLYIYIIYFIYIYIMSIYRKAYPVLHPLGDPGKHLSSHR